MGAGIKERQSEQNERGNHPARPQCAAASSAVGSIHGGIAKFVILFSHVSKKWSTYVMPLCPVLKWPMGQLYWTPTPVVTKPFTKKSCIMAHCQSEDFKSDEGAVGKIQGASEESYEGLAKPRRPHHHLAACTDATPRPRREHRRTICRISRSVQSPDNRTARR